VHDPFAPDPGHQVHVVLGLLKPLGTLHVVIHDPLSEADRALDRQAEIGDASLQVDQRAAALCVLLDGADPRLDSLIACLGGYLDFPHEAQLLAANRSGVQAE
jgi:hypothetical protein